MERLLRWHHRAEDISGAINLLLWGLVLLISNTEATSQPFVSFVQETIGPLTWASFCFGLAVFRIWALLFRHKRTYIATLLLSFLFWAFLSLLCALLLLPVATLIFGYLALVESWICIRVKK